jgi:uncharacterized membrane protein YfcA
MDHMWMVVAAAFLVAAYVKGTTAMGFPLIATPMVAMVVDIRTAYALLLAPNIAMDVLQVVRGGIHWTLLRRLWPVLLGVVPGVFGGTRVLFAVTAQTIHLALAAVILLFVVSEQLRVSVRVQPKVEPWVSPAAGLLCGLLNGVTNVIGPLAAIYLLALDMEKREFVKAMAWILFTAKVSQLVAIARWGLFTGEIAVWSASLTVIAAGAFWVGLKTQDRVRQGTFRGILRVLLLGMALVFIYRGVTG